MALLQDVVALLEEVNSKFNGLAKFCDGSAEHRKELSKVLHLSHKCTADPSILEHLISLDSCTLHANKMKNLNTRIA